MADFREQLQQSLGSAYTIDRELGGGGMSRVFLARDAALGRDVVIKLLTPEMAGGMSAERFAREIKVVAALQEPHIVPVLAAGSTSDALPWYSMPFVRGQSLRERLGHGHLPIGEATGILRNVAQALAYAHRQGIVHRDIKPENVLLSEGTAVVTDFGIAKALSVSKSRQVPGSTLTSVGMSLGTPAYMAPEQAAGGDVDARADLYAWGVMAYELLGDTHPFAGKTTAQQLVAAHLSEVPAALVTRRSDIPPSVAAIVMQCLAKEPSARPASADDLMRALDAAASARAGDERIVNEPAKARLSRWVLAAAVIVVVVVGGVLWRGRPAGAAQPPLIAVLPFETEGAGADATFAGGLGDAITRKLMQLAALRIVDQKSVMSAKDAGRGQSPQQTGRLLGAAYVLRASVRFARGADGQMRVQVSPTLVNVADGTTKWAGEPEIVSPADPFTVQASVATKVAQALDVALGSRDRAKLEARGTSDTAAFAAYIQGERLVTGLGFAGQAIVYQQAAREFERAARADPKFADALGAAASAYLYAVIVGAPPSLLDSAGRLADRALELSPNQADALATKAGIAILGGDPQKALALIEHAARESPSNLRILTTRASVRVFVGDSAGAWAAVEEYLKLAPRSDDAWGESAEVALGLRRYVDVDTALRRARQLQPERYEGDITAAWAAGGRGDTSAIAGALRDYRAHGGRLAVDQLRLLRSADATFRAELAASSPQAFGAVSARDSMIYYASKSELFMLRGDASRARALLDSAWAETDVMIADKHVAPLLLRDGILRSRAWVAAARGDRVRALAALDTAAKSAVLVAVPNGTQAEELACVATEVYAFLGDVDHMLPHLRRCLTLPDGETVSSITRQPSMTKYLNDPRVLAIMRPLKLQVGRPE